MKVKIGDTVKIIAGKDRGKEGKVTKTFKVKDRVLVDSINMVTKHQKPGKANESGSIVTREAPIHVSNVKVIESAKKEKKVAKKEDKKETKKVTKKAKGEVNE